jgi:hypothetical protein
MSEPILERLKLKQVSWWFWGSQQPSLMGKFPLEWRGTPSHA